MRRPRRLRSPVVLALASLLVLAGCGGGDDEPSAAPGDTTVARVAPLTGLPLTDPDKLGRPALAVKVGNAPASRPQSGLDAADVVFEEIVEGGITRFVAVFHSTDADLVGPVRSLRPSDPDIVAPFRGLFAYSGGIPRFVEALRDTPGTTDVGVDALGEGADEPYTRRAGRSAPANLYTSTPKIYAEAPDSGMEPPRPFAEFLPEGQPFAAADATPATNLTVTVGRTDAVFDYDAASGTYRRSGLAEGDGVVAPANVIVQFTAYEDTNATDQSGATVEKAVTVGSGEAIVVAGGMAVRGRWSRPSAGEFTTYTDAAGAPIKLLPGRTWVELARPGAPAATR